MIDDGEAGVRRGTGHGSCVRNPDDGRTATPDEEKNARRRLLSEGGVVDGRQVHQDSSSGRPRSSLSNRATSSRTSLATITVASPRNVCDAVTASGKRSRTSLDQGRGAHGSNTGLCIAGLSSGTGRWPVACCSAILSCSLIRPSSTVLGSWRTARDVDVDGHDRVDAHDGGVVVVEAARAGTDAERDDPLGLGHLVVDALQDRRHLVTDGADHEEHVGLARRESAAGRRQSDRHRSESRPWPCTPCHSTPSRTDTGRSSTSGPSRWPRPDGSSRIRLRQTSLVTFLLPFQGAVVPGVEEPSHEHAQEDDRSRPGPNIPRSRNTTAHG